VARAVPQAEVAQVLKDIKHILVNAPLVLPYFLFTRAYGPGYDPSGATGLFMLCVALLLPLDDWLESRRGFPLWLLPVIVLMLFINPVMGLLAVSGYYLVNLRVFLGHDHWLLERVEALGNVPLYVLPLVAPVERWDILAFGLGACVAFDCFHKLGHWETPWRQKAWVHGLCLMTYLAGLLLFTRGPQPAILLGMMSFYLSVLPFTSRSPRFTYWYYQLWESVGCFICYWIILFA